MIQQFLTLPMSAATVTENAKESVFSMNKPFEIFAEELRFIDYLLSGTTVFMIVSSMALLGVVLVLLSRFTRRWTQRHRLTSLNVPAIQMFLQIAIFVVGAAVLFRFLFVHIPVVATGTAVVAAATFGVVLFRRLPAWFSGILLVLQRRINVGDMVQLDSWKGTVEKIGLFRFALADSDGARLYVSVSAIGGRSVTVSSPTKKHLVDFVYRSPDHQPLLETDIHHIRTIAVLCPYRLSTSTVKMECAAETPHQIRIRFRTWSEDASVQALRFLPRAIQNVQSEKGR